MDVTSFNDKTMSGINFTNESYLGNQLRKTLREAEMPKSPNA